jgi:hypothetical protein
MGSGEERGDCGEMVEDRMMIGQMKVKAYIEIRIAMWASYLE